MADLSQLSDSELKVYHDMLVQKQIPPNPSDSIPKSKPPIPSALQRKPYLQELGSNIGPSVLRSVMSTASGPQMGGNVNRDSQGHVDLNADIRPLLNIIKHPIDSFRDDPVQTTNTFTGVAQGVKDLAQNTSAGPVISGAARGARNSAMEPMSARGFGRYLPVPVPKAIAGGIEGEIIGRHFGIPKTGAVIGTVAPAVKGAYEGGKEALAEYNSNQPGGSNYQNPIIKRILNLGKDTSGSLNLGRFGGSGSGLEVPTDGPETAAARPVTRQGGQGQGTPTNEPSASQQNVRPVIRDENGVPLMYSDTKAPDINQPAQEIRPVKKTNPIDKPYEGIERRRAQDEGKNPDDIFTKIANEGLAKRAADAKAKYEDIYNTHIKGQMSPDQVRSLATDPEARTQFDMKIKAMKHPEGHAKAGQKKYSSGINPDVIDHLASRLEAESPE